MAPGLGPLPPAGAVGVVEVLERYLAGLPRHNVAIIRLALRAFEWMSFPWRFSRADLRARAELLERVESSGSALGRDLILLLKVLTGVAYGSDPGVCRAVGYEQACRASDEPEPHTGAESPLGDLAPGGDAEECDVLVIGSGAGGAVAASVLAEAGVDVIVIEAGPHLDRCSYPEEPLEALSTLYRDGGLTVATGRPSIPTPVGRAVGGTTVINSGTCLRAPERVLADWARRHGIAWAPGLDSAYETAEKALSVTTVDTARMGRNGEVLRDGADAVGASHAPLRRNAGGCFQCSSCPIGCRIDAKRAMHVSYLPRAVAAGARVRADVEAKRITFDGTRATGVECVARASGTGPARPYAVDARRAVVLAGGSFGTPELLLRSGFRSASGELGRNLRIHPACWVGARFADEIRGWDGVMQSYAVDEWQDRGLLLEATFTPLAFGGQWLPGSGREHQRRLLDYRHLASTGVHLSDRSSGRVRLARDGSLRVAYRLTRDDAALLTFGIAKAAELYYAAGAIEVYPQISGVPVLAAERIADLEAAPPPRAGLRLEAFHPMGTARMDADPARGVVAADGSVHGLENLIVADASVLPSSLGVNPMMTVVALASHLAQGLADRLA